MNPAAVMRVIRRGYASPVFGLASLVTGINPDVSETACAVAGVLVGGGGAVTSAVCVGV